ncbi:MAG: hypothetical protein OK438_06575 [Thaumarchaeota archaeon]|nr:hypothetical protein [Nitrososphaerota archaeon]
MDGSAKATEETVEMGLGDLEEALRFVKADASNLLSDLLRGISMWGFTALMAFLLAAICLVLSQVILTYAHPYGSLPPILDILYVSYGFAIGSAFLGFVLFWRYYSLRKRYARLFEIVGSLRR